MADLSAVAVRRYGRIGVMSPLAGLVVNMDVGESLRQSEAVARSITLLAALQAEVIKASANTVSRILDFPSSGEVAFVVNPAEHDAIVNSYTARVRVYGSATVVATQALGKPSYDGNNVIIVDLTATFAGLAAGNYTVSILATAAGGSADSAESAPFALPLP